MSRNRLTELLPNGAWRIHGSIGEAVLRLAAYEDSGFTPEKLQDMQWIPVEERLPELPKSDYCSVMVLTAYKRNPRSRPMIYERSLVRGRRVERWKYYWDRIADELPDYWMPLLCPPKEDVR